MDAEGLSYCIDCIRTAMVEFQGEFGNELYVVSIKDSDQLVVQNCMR